MEIQNYLFFGISFLSLAIFAGFKNKPLTFDLNVTNEIKGLAILMIIFAHIGYALAPDNRFLFPLSVGGGIGVNLFFFLSGYGLSVSTISKGLPIFTFYKKRLINLFLPLWAILVIILLLDNFLLNKTYPFSEIWHSFLGYFPVADFADNINSPLWFITPILFYYLIFPLIYNKKYLSLVGMGMIFLSYILLFNNKALGYLTSNEIINRDVLTLYRTHFAAFPLGVIAADLITNKNILQKVWLFLTSFLRSHKKILHLIYPLSLIFGLYIIYYTAIYSGVGKGDLKEQYISLITVAAILFVFIFSKLKSGLLAIFGTYSYEIYLMHWPILKRFDIFYKYFPPFLATAFYLGLFICLAYVLNKLVKLISAKVFKMYN